MLFHLMKETLMSATEACSSNASSTYGYADFSTHHRKGKTICALALNGGGVKGGAQLEVLADLEKRTGMATGEIFQHFSGTSVGGIINALLTLPDGKGGFKYSAKEAQDIFLKVVHLVFDESLLYKVRSAGGILAPRYKPAGLEKAMAMYFAGVKLSELGREYFAPTVDLDELKPYYFRRCDALKDPKRDLLLTDVLRAVPSAETYWPAAREEIDGETHVLADGGIAAYNNPCMYSVSQCQQLYNCGRNMELVYISTGIDRTPVPEKAYDGGVARWLPHLMRVRSSIDTQMACDQARQMLGDRFSELNPPVGDVALDTTKDSELMAMIENTKGWIEDNDEMLRKLALSLERAAIHNAEIDATANAGQGCTIS